MWIYYIYVQSGAIVHIAKLRYISNGEYVEFGL